MRPLALAIAFLLSGCAVSAGPVIVHAPALGFESPYLGATVRGDLVHKRFLARAEASYLDAQKIQTGDGHGLTAEALAGARFGHLGRFRALAGYRWNQIETSLYTKDSAQALAEAGYHFRSGGILSATYSLETDGSGWDSYGLRCEVPMRRVLMVSAWEHMRFADQQGHPAEGDRISIAALWRFNR